MKGTPYGHWMAVRRTLLVSAAAAAILGVAAASSGAAAGDATVLVSNDGCCAAGDGESLSSSVSANGRFVAFQSDAQNLAGGGDPSGLEVMNILLRDRDTDQDGIFDEDGEVGMQLASPGATAASSTQEGNKSPAISANGRYVAFESDAVGLVDGDTNNRPDAFVFDRETWTVERVSVDSNEQQPMPGPTPVAGEDVMKSVSISSDGRYVAFQSSFPNLVAGDTNGRSDIFVRDRQEGTTKRVSVTTSGAQATGLAASEGSIAPSISADGSAVAFQTDATNLAPSIDPAEGGIGIVVRERDIDKDGIFDEAGASRTEPVSVNSGEAPADDESLSPSISGNGRYVAFQSLATNLNPLSAGGDSNLLPDVFLRDRQAGTTEMVSVNSDEEPVFNDQMNTKLGSGSASVSSDGRYVAFHSDGTNLVSDDGNLIQDAFVRDRTGGTTKRASLGVDGNEASGDPLAGPGKGDSANPSISADGSSVAFDSDTVNLVQGDGNMLRDVFVRTIGDKIAPNIKSVAPKDGISNRPITTKPAIAFTESMDPATISTSTFTVSKRVTSSTGAISWVKIAGTVTYDDTKKLATFAPTGGLAKGTKYKVNASPAMKDLAGNQLDTNPTTAGAQGKVWYFSTVN